MKDFIASSEQLKQGILKESVISGTISQREFLDELLALDQATPSRDAAKDNGVILEDTDVKRLFSNGEYAADYLNLLSLTHFHIGQMEILHDPREALAHFRSALTAASEIHESGSEEWTAYIEGTIAYLEKDKEGVRRAMAKLSDGRNKEILARCAMGLEQRGEPDYLTDYSKK
jgi:hypothetical protein